jgi:hypothetical protein
MVACWAAVLLFVTVKSANVQCCCRRKEKMIEPSNSGVLKRRKERMKRRNRRFSNIFGVGEDLAVKARGKAPLLDMAGNHSADEDVGSIASSNPSEDLEATPSFDLDGIDFEPPTPPAASLVDKDTVQPRRRKQFSVLTDDDGDTYFVDNETQETWWDLPEDGDVVEI